MKTAINNVTTTLAGGQPVTQQGSSTSPIVLKVQFNEDVRRVSLPQLSFDLLTQKVAEAFKIRPASRVVLKYQDEEGDLVTIGCAEELEDAQRQHKAMLCIVASIKKRCINVKPTTSTATEMPPSPSPSASTSVPTSTPAPPTPTPTPTDKVVVVECNANTNAKDEKEKRQAIKEQRKVVREEKKKLRHETKEAAKQDARCEGKKMHHKQEKEASTKKHHAQCKMSPEERAAKREEWRKMSKEERAAILAARREARLHKHANAVQSEDASASTPAAVSSNDEKHVSPKTDEIPTTPSAEKEKPTFAESLKQLKDLGFYDVAKNINLLQQHDGDVNKVIADLLA